MSSRSLVAINSAVLFAAFAYGITFALLALRLHDMQVSGFLLGLNAAMPPLGWLVGSLAAPRLQALLGIKRLTLLFLAAGTCALAASSVATDYATSTALRFLLGGGIGMFFRSIEYWINGITPAAHKGRDLAIYNLTYNVGLIAGSVAHPELASAGWSPVYASLGAFAIGATIIALLPRLAAPDPSRTGTSPLNRSVLAIAPAAFLAIFAYGLFEDIPVYLTSVYALRNGMNSDIASYTVTAAVIGNLLFPMPLAWLSDYTGRMGPLIACALVVAVASVALPFSLERPIQFLAVIVIWAGCAGAMYTIVLAMLGDRFSGAALVAANAMFGIVYACGAIVGPLINGAALDTLNSHGVMASAAIIFLVLSAGLAAIHVRAKPARAT